MLQLRDGKLILVIYKIDEDQPECELELQDFDEHRDSDDVVLHADYEGRRYFVSEKVEEEK